VPQQRTEQQAGHPTLCSTSVLAGMLSSLAPFAVAGAT
jgi:hypothetical protein